MKWRSGLVFLSALALCFLAACSDDPSFEATGTDNQSTPVPFVPATGPAIIAAPNPVPAGGGLTGTTVVAWNTGGGAAEVYLSTNGSDEKLFARSGSAGSQDAPWIAAGQNYEFRLYSADDRSKRLGSVAVTRNP